MQYNALTFIVVAFVGVIVTHHLALIAISPVHRNSATAGGNKHIGCFVIATV